jgi:hypothetical protein
VRPKKRIPKQALPKSASQRHCRINMPTADMLTSSELSNHMPTIVRIRAASQNHKKLVIPYVFGQQNLWVNSLGSGSFPKL